MSVKLINNTASDITLSDCSNLVIPAGGSIHVNGSRMPSLASSAELIRLVGRRSLSISNETRTLPTNLGLNLVRGMRDPLLNLSEFGIDVASGNIPNMTPRFVVGYSNTIGTTYADIWMAPGILSTPTTAESYEILSDSASDTVAGVGARTVLLTSLDANGLETQTLVNLNGTTPVAIPGTHTFTNGLLCVSFGSSAENVGNITLRVSGGGLTRSYIIATEGNALSAFYKVPSNKYFYIKGLDFHTGGAAKPVDIRVRVMLPGSNGFVSTAVVPFIETSFNSSFTISAEYPPGTLIKYQAKVDAGTGSVALILSGVDREIDT